MVEQERDTGTQETGKGRMGRRGLVAAAAAFVAGIAATGTAQRAGAASDFTFNANAGSTTTYAFYTSTSNYTYGASLTGYSFGVSASGSGPSGYGVYGSGNLVGVYGGATGSGDYGVFGSGGGYGVYGTSTSGYGAYGYSGSSNGVRGQSGSNIGVYGTAPQFGVVGNATANGGYGIYGLATVDNSAGFAGGTTNPNAYAAVFGGRVVVNGPFTVTGAKSAAVPHPDGSHRRLYCVEAPEAWFEDFGEGRLAAGRAEVRLDPDFAAVVDMGSLHVFFTERDENRGLTLKGRTATGFTVEADAALLAMRGRRMTDATGAFSYRVVARRKDVVGGRLERVEIPKIAAPPIPTDSPKPPELPKPPPPPDGQH